MPCSWRAAVMVIAPIAISQVPLGSWISSIIPTKVMHCSIIIPTREEGVSRAGSKARAQQHGAGHHRRHRRPHAP